MSSPPSQNGTSQPSERRTSKEIAVTKLNKWYETETAEHVKQWTEPAAKANKDKIQNGFEEVKLTTQERISLKNVKSLEQFLDLTKDLEGEHAKKKGGEARNKMQEYMADFQLLGKAFSPVIDAIPYGAGNVAWGLCSIVITVVVEKHKKEMMIRDFLVRITKSLPGLKFYSEIYPTERMVKLLAELYAKVIVFLHETFLYYRRPKQFCGSLRRIFSSVGTFGTDMNSLIADIGSLSKEMQDEGILGLSAEMRDTRLTGENTNAELRDTKVTVTKLARQLSKVEKVAQKLKMQVHELQDIEADKERMACLRDIHRLKSVLAYPAYDSAEVHAAAKRQNNAFRTRCQMNSCENFLQDPNVVNWLHSVPDSKTASPCKSMLWVTSKDTQDDTISHCAIEAHCAICSRQVEDESKVSIVLYSMHQTEYKHPALSDGKRTVSTITNEAIYQLLEAQPLLMHRSEKVKALLRMVDDDLPKEKTLQLDYTFVLLRNLLDHVPVPVFWIIDRIDDCNPKKLAAFSEQLRFVVDAQQGKLRVLITSLFEPTRVAKDWYGNQDEDEDAGVRSEEWVELIYDGDS